jgi:hypothetical protein
VSRRVAAVACALVLAGCSTSGSPGGAEKSPSSTPVRGPGSLDLGDSFVLLDFDRSDPLEAQAAGVALQVRREGDAPLQTVESGDGTRGLAFPSYAAVDEKRLVLLLGLDQAGPAKPSSGVLRFGADVRLQSGTASGPNDNGDNVVQRGLYSDSDQFKLQVDKRVPSCSVRTPRLRAVASLGQQLGDGWYRLGCRYDGATVTVSATQMSVEGASPVQVKTDARAGALSFPTSTGVSVGGKVTADGTLVRTQPDQFNGALDNVYVSPGQ